MQATASNNGTRITRPSKATKIIVGDAPVIEVKQGSLILMAGASGIGKSTWAKKNFPNAKIVSADGIRGELYKDENGDPDESCQDNPRKVFAIVHSRIKRALKNGDTVIVDITGFTGRNNYIAMSKENNRDAHMVLLHGPLDMHLQGQQTRKRKVPTEVVERQHQSATDLAKKILTRQIAEEGFKSVSLLTRAQSENASVKVL